MLSIWECLGKKNSRQKKIISVPFIYKYTFFCLFKYVFGNMEDTQQILLFMSVFLYYSYLYENLLEIFLMKGMMCIEKVIGGAR